MRKMTAAVVVATSLMIGASINNGADAMASAQQSKTTSCNPKPVHRLDKYTTWQYVTPTLAHYEHIGRCSKVIVGKGQSVIIGQDGHVADES
jgi:hypothetical protein